MMGFAPLNPSYWLAAGALMGFASEDDWLDYQLENDPRFLRRVEQARKSLREGHEVNIENVE